jgi:hypothetical protein
MEATLTAIEVTGSVDENHQLRLDQRLPIAGPKRVRVIVLYPLDEEPDELDETEWLRAAANNPAFQFLHEASEDIYSLADGKPLHDEE